MVGNIQLKNLWSDSLFYRKKLLESKTVLENQGLIYIAHNYQSVSLQTKLTSQKPAHET